MDKKFTILYVDDEESNLNIFSNTFRREYKIITALNAKEGLKILENEQVDLILTDQRMPEMTGVDFLKQALHKYPDLNRILITAFTEFDALQSAVNEAQIFQYIQKPWTEKDLRDIIEGALQVYQLKKENEMLNKQLMEKNKQLEELNKEILDLDKMKSEFLSLVSHEIRTPLNGLVGPIQLLKHVVDQDKSRELTILYDILEKSVSRLEQFALSAEKITVLKAKRYDLNLESIEIKEVFEKSIAMLEEKIRAKNIIIKFSPNNTKVDADRDLLIICTREILDNSIKHSEPDGKIQVNFSETPDISQIDIIDDGSGFDEKIMKNLFKLFVTGEKYVDNDIGIDLALIKLIMEAHDGQVIIENNEDKGATVSLVINKLR